MVLLSGNTVLGEGRVQDVKGVYEVVFNVEFLESGTYSFTVDYLGNYTYESSTSNTVTMSVTMPSSSGWGWGGGWGYNSWGYKNWW
jgi:hypothetical protein